MMMVALIPRSRAANATACGHLMDSTVSSWQGVLVELTPTLRSKLRLEQFQL
jgi:hypothetical protein